MRWRYLLEQRSRVVPDKRRVVSSDTQSSEALEANIVKCYCRKCHQLSCIRHNYVNPTTPIRFLEERAGKQNSIRSRIPPATLNGVLRVNRVDLLWIDVHQNLYLVPELCAWFDGCTELMWGRYSVDRVLCGISMKADRFLNGRKGEHGNHSN